MSNHTQRATHSAGRSCKSGLGWLRAAILLLAVLALAGCSRIAVETTPFGKKTYRVDTAESAERINAWPIFYHRGEATSILWPLFQKTA